MDTPLTHDAQQTLFRILHHPTSQNIGWDELVTLLDHVADVEKGHDGAQIVVRLNDERLALRRPKTDTVAEQSLLEIRRMLNGAGIR